MRWESSEETSSSSGESSWKYPTGQPYSWQSRAWTSRSFSRARADAALPSCGGAGRSTKPNRSSWEGVDMRQGRMNAPRNARQSPLGRVPAIGVPAVHKRGHPHAEQQRQPRRAVRFSASRSSPPLPTGTCTERDGSGGLSFFVYIRKPTVRWHWKTRRGSEHQGCRIFLRLVSVEENKIFVEKNRVFLRRT